MVSCDRCGQIVDDGESDAAQEVLSFCMKYNLGPKNLVVLTDQDIQDAYEALSVPAQTMIADLADTMRAGQAGSSKPTGTKPTGATGAKPKRRKAKKHQGQEEA